MQTILNTRKKAPNKGNDIDSLVRFSNEMREEPTPSERDAFDCLAANGIKVQVQVVFGFYILDFVVPEKMLCIEIDGSSHDGRSLYDYRRDKFVKYCGLKVIRIPASRAGSCFEKVAKIENVENYKERWRKAQEAAAKIRSNTEIQSFAIGKEGRDKKYTKKLYTPKKKQAHTAPDNKKKKRAKSSSLDSVSSVLERKQAREARRAELKR